MKRIATLLIVALLALGCGDNQPPPPKRAEKFGLIFPGNVPGTNTVTTAALQNGSVTNVKLANSGTAAGRLGVEVLIERATLTAAASYTSTNFTGGAFRQLRFRIRADSGTATGQTITLTGLTNSYKFGSYYSTQPAAAPAEIAAATWAWNFTATPMFIAGDIYIESGGIRLMVANQMAPNGLGAGSPIFYGPVIGQNTDTTNEVTAFVFTFTGGTATGTAELWGLP